MPEDFEELFQLAQIEHSTQVDEYVRHAEEHELPLAFKLDKEVYLNVDAIVAIQAQLLEAAKEMSEHPGTEPMVQLISDLTGGLAIVADAAKVFVGVDPRPLD